MASPQFVAGYVPAPPAMCTSMPPWAARLPKPQSDELELLKELPDFDEATSRLSCQVDFTEALSGIKVAIAPDT